MYRHQAQRRTSSRQKAALGAQSVNEPSAPKSTKRKRWLQLMRRYPLLWLLTAWLALVLLASLAIMAMVNLDASTPQPMASIAPLPTAISAPPRISAPQVTLSPPAPPALQAPLLPSEAPAPAAARQGKQQSLPWVSLAVIVLSCAIGCLTFLQCLKPRHPNQSRASASLTRSSRSSRTRVKSLTQPRKERTSKASVSVVPSKLDHPLDWDEPSLADNLDLRQKRPLSHWLQ